LLLADDRVHPIACVGLLLRAGYRYRSELAPMLTVGALYMAALVLHARGVAPLGVALVALAVAGALCWPRVAPLLRRVERGYAVAVVLAAGAWLTAATAVGPTTQPLPFLLVGGAVIGGVPWWAHRRRRAKVRVERTLDAWPDIADAVGLPGSRIMSAVVDRWGWRARIGLSAGQTATDLVNSAAALESGLHTRPGAVRVEPDPDRADHALIRVLTADPHAQPIPYPTGDGGRPPTGGASPTRSHSACSRTPSRSRSGSRTATACSAVSPAPARAASSTFCSPNSSAASTSSSGASTSRAAWSSNRGPRAWTDSPPPPTTPPGS
jgi:S-DNA-T family DNA segregation ATPase FtsK/SpoIIIE